MKDIEIKLDVEPKENYEKAKIDLLQAKQSFEKLTAQEQQKLICELFEAEIAKRLIMMYRF